MGYFVPSLVSFLPSSVVTSFLGLFCTLPLFYGPLASVAGQSLSSCLRFSCRCVAWWATFYLHSCRFSRPPSSVITSFLGLLCTLPLLLRLCGVRRLPLSLSFPVFVSHVVMSFAGLNCILLLFLRLSRQFRSRQCMVYGSAGNKSRHLLRHQILA